MVEGTTAPSSDPLRVLYVEDDRISALLFSEALRDQAGLALRLAEDGAQAMAEAAQWLPQVLVLDAHLPDTRGHALLARLRQLPGLAKVPAFMCSADGGAQDIAQALAAGFQGYWVKPVATDELRSALLRLRSGLT